MRSQAECDGRRQATSGAANQRLTLPWLTGVDYGNPSLESPVVCRRGLAASILPSVRWIEAARFED